MQILIIMLNQFQNTHDVILSVLGQAYTTSPQNATQTLENHTPLYLSS